MIALTKRLYKLFSEHRYGLVFFAFMLAAILTGFSCVAFMRGFEAVLARRLDFQSVGGWCLLSTPALFLLSVELIRRVAPCAGGTGIPQVIFAIRQSKPGSEAALAPLTSPLTMVVKVAALLIALAAGASTGREGPTVHIATCIFVGLLLLMRRLLGVEFDLRSAMVAGGAAGLAAAFNTPLAGVTFAVEELTTDYFANIKDFVIMAIVISAIAAKSLYGEYSYFGRLLEPDGVPVYASILIGLLAGVAGAFFSSAILHGKAFVSQHQAGSKRYLVPAALSLALVAVAWLSPADVLGPGNEAAQDLTRGRFASWALLFPGAKMLATLLTYWSGIAGGIFAPSLSIGAALGADMGHWLGLPVASCAMIGMAAFLSGTIQAPITSFVIIFEMTGHHHMLTPIMLASLLAFIVARVLGAEHLYPTLSKNYQSLLPADGLS
ncbi:MAG: chloride channel protein [Elusimicrobia bacterium]|nr:chloride channel protein [Elusimicrobiota bacterium]